jgi:hypothetical protein
VDHRGDDVRILEVEVVAGPVEVRQHRHAGVQAVLAPVRLREGDQETLRDAVRGVRLLRIPVPDLVLSERDWGVLGIGADRTDGDELLDAEGLARREDVECHRGVVGDQRRRVAKVVADAADVGGEVDDHPRPLQRLAGLAGVPQVELRGSRRPDLGAELLQHAHRGLAEEARPAGDGDPPPPPEVCARRGAHVES